MTKILLRLICSLLILHGFATFVAGRFLPLAAIGDRLLFAQHGFTFVFLGLLNLVVWQPVLRGALSRSAVHLGNFSFALFYAAISLRHSEPPNVVGAILSAAVFLVGLSLECRARTITAAPV